METQDPGNGTWDPGIRVTRAVRLGLYGPASMFGPQNFPGGRDMFCSSHGSVYPCGGFRPNEKLACDQSRPHCPICGAALT